MYGSYGTGYGKKMYNHTCEEYETGEVKIIIRKEVFSCLSIINNKAGSKRLANQAAAVTDKRDRTEG